MVAVAQLVRASDCGSEGRGFETPRLPRNRLTLLGGFFIPFLPSLTGLLFFRSFLVKALL